MTGTVRFATAVPIAMAVPRRNHYDLRRIIISRAIMRAFAHVSIWMLAGIAFAAWSAAPSAPGVREIKLTLPASGKTGFTLLGPEQTHVTFTNSLDEWASANNRVLNNGSGIAAGDFDNDGRVDLF